MSSRKSSGKSASFALSPPERLVLCSCTDCQADPDVQQNLAPGRLIPKSEAQEHMKDENRQNIARSCHARLFGKSKTPPPSPPNQSSTPIASIHGNPSPPDPSKRSLPPQEALEEIEDLKRMCKQLKAPEKVLGERVPYFVQPPTNKRYLKTSEMSNEEVDALCRLDTNISSNSPVIGYQQLLIRTKSRASSALQADAKALQAQAKITIRLVDQLQVDLRERLLQEWRLQRSALKKPGYYDSCEFSLIESNPAVRPMHLLFPQRATSRPSATIFLWWSWDTTLSWPQSTSSQTFRSTFAPSS